MFDSRMRPQHSIYISRPSHGSPRFSHGPPTALPRSSHGPPTVLPRSSHGPATVLPPYDYLVTCTSEVKTSRLRPRTILMRRPLPPFRLWTVPSIVESLDQFLQGEAVGRIRYRGATPSQRVGSIWKAKTFHSQWSSQPTVYNASVWKWTSQQPTCGRLAEATWSWLRFGAPEYKRIVLKQTRGCWSFCVSTL